MQTNIIHNESCVETLKKLSNQSIDLVITSPPYNMNIRVQNGKYQSRSLVKEFSNKYGASVDSDTFADNLHPDEYFEFHSKVLTELLRVSPIIFYNIQIVTGSKRAMFRLIGEFYETLKDIIIWDKGNAQPAMCAGVLNRQSELILVFDATKGISRKFDTCYFNRGTLNDVWNIKRSRKIDASHGAVFPEELVTKILTNFSKEGDVVYDPFMGVGTTAVVSKQMNRKYIGSEINAHYCAVAEERLKSVVM